MPYALRPGHKIKRPVRFEDYSGDEQDVAPEPWHDASRSDDASLHNTLSAPVHKLREAHFQRRAPFAQYSNSEVAASDSNHKSTSERGLQSLRSMANIKYVRKEVSPRDGTPSATPGTRQPRGRPVIREPHVQPVNASIFPTARPSAFPSKSAGSPSPDVHIENEDRHGVKQRLRARELSDEQGIAQSIRRVDDMYALKQFPAEMEAREQTWYNALQNRWDPCEDDRPILFSNLYYSLRQTIIAEIHGQFPEGLYHDTFHPVKVILGLSGSAFSAIQSEDSKPWNVEDPLPKHVEDYKMRNRNMMVDPDSPPPAEIVQAIKFLRQEHLPCSLLGEWQYPLPPIEVFAAWTQCLTPATPHRQAGKSTIDRPNILPPQKTAAWLLNHGWKSPGISTTKDLFPMLLHTRESLNDFQASVKENIKEQREEKRQMVAAQRTFGLMLAQHAKARKIHKGLVRDSQLTIAPTKNSASVPGRRTTQTSDATSVGGIRHAALQQLSQEDSRLERDGKGKGQERIAADEIEHIDRENTLHMSASAAAYAQAMAFAAAQEAELPKVDTVPYPKLSWPPPERQDWRQSMFPVMEYMYGESEQLEGPHTQEGILGIRDFQTRTEVAENHGETNAEVEQGALTGYHGTDDDDWVSAALKQERED
ncbi:hypothetical protein ACN47E_009710 [Coniothyrium glycines]